jgi:hypothetical protein
MFKISQSDSYTWPVSVESAISGGKFEKETFDAEFKRVSQTRIQEIIKLVEPTPPLISDVDLAKEVLVGWKGVVDANGEVPYSEAARDTILDKPGTASAIVTAFYASLSGGKRKN